MNKLTFISCLLMAFSLMSSCGYSSAKIAGEHNDTSNVETTYTVVEDYGPIPPDSATFYSEVVDKMNCFILVSKCEYRLYVCEVVGADTVKRVHYPVCVALNKGQKQKKNDMRTPECSFDNSFTIIQIQDASSWRHDFSDGRGSILSYGNWFLRLDTPGFSGIGIHGSTNNESSVPGRGSEGCIRLRNDDLDDLKEKYAFVGMRVVILPDE